MFGEKYDDVLRVFDVPGISVNLRHTSCYAGRLQMPAAVRNCRLLPPLHKSHFITPAGTHVSNTSEIGAFKVVSEGGIASGVRRIEAVAGQAAVEYLQGVDAVVRSLAGSLKVRFAGCWLLWPNVAGARHEPAGCNQSPFAPYTPPAPHTHTQARPEEIVGRVSSLQEELKAAGKQLAEAKSQLAVAKSQVRCC